MNQLSKEEIDQIDREINDLLGYYKYVLPTVKRKGYKEDQYKALIEYKIKKLLNTKLQNQVDTEKDFDEYMRQMDMGKKVEKEHEVNDLEATKIASDHLEEDPKYYSKLKKMEESNNLSFENYFKLASNLEDDVLGLIEPIKIEGIDADLIALVDTGNEAYNVLHGVDIEDAGDRVTFITANKKRITKDKVDEITIHVGAGHDEHRPVVEFTIEIAGKVYPDVRFSIGDRTENQHPVLIGVDFIKQIGSLIDVNKK